MPRTYRSPFSVLRDRIARTGSQQAAARSLRISPQYLCDVLKGRREISAELARRLGYKRVVVYLEGR